jgi:hypothetical protein
MPGAGDQHLLPRRQQVGDHGLPGAVAVAGIHEDVGGGGLQQRLEPGFAGLDHAVEPRVGQVHGLAPHRIHDLVGHPRGAG